LLPLETKQNKTCYILYYYSTRSLRHECKKARAWWNTRPSYIAFG